MLFTSSWSHLRVRGAPHRNPLVCCCISRVSIQNRLPGSQTTTPYCSHDPVKDAAGNPTMHRTGQERKSVELRVRRAGSQARAVTGRPSQSGFEPGGFLGAHSACFRPLVTARLLSLTRVSDRTPNNRFFGLTPESFSSFSGQPFSLGSYGVFEKCENIGKPQVFLVPCN